VVAGVGKGVEAGAGEVFGIVSKAGSPMGLLNSHPCSRLLAVNKVMNVNAADFLVVTFAIKIPSWKWLMTFFHDPMKKLNTF
jgi:hypothetical protein